MKGSLVLYVALALGPAIGCGEDDPWAAHCDRAYQSLDALAIPGASRTEAAADLLEGAPGSVEAALTALAQDPDGEPLDRLAARTQQGRALEDLYGELARHCTEGTP